MEGLVISYQMVGSIAEQLLDNITLGRRAHKPEVSRLVDGHVIYSAIYSDETHFVDISEHPYVCTYDGLRPRNCGRIRLLCPQ